LAREKVQNLVLEYRKILPKTGTRKLYEYLEPKLMEINIKMGRDAINDLLRLRGMLIKKPSVILVQQTPNTSFINRLIY
jgi:putative transposase